MNYYTSDFIVKVYFYLHFYTKKIFLEVNIYNWFYKQSNG